MDCAVSTRLVRAVSFLTVPENQQHVLRYLTALTAPLSRQHGARGCS
jgi:hypothetical protein